MINQITIFRNYEANIIVFIFQIFFAYIYSINKKTMKNVKAVTITLTDAHKDKAKEISKAVFGKENISGIIGYLIENWKKES
jgi:hypothetical protein